MVEAEDRDLPITRALASSLRFKIGLALFARSMRDRMVPTDFGGEFSLESGGWSAGKFLGRLSDPSLGLQARLSQAGRLWGSQAEMFLELARNRDSFSSALEDISSMLQWGSLEPILF